jgi:hypothetical protein
MRKMMWNVLGVLTCTCLIAATATASEKPTATGHRTNAMEIRATRGTWPPETLAGKIMMVDPAKNLVIVKGPDGVPFDMVVTPSTRITSGDHDRLALKDLKLDNLKSVSVRFIPERAGDVARSIQVTE